MAAKLFHRSNARDVFDEVAEEAATPTDDHESATPQADSDPPTAASGTDEPAEASESTGADEPATAAPRPRWRRYAVATIAGLVVIGVLAGTGFLGWRVKQEREIAAASAAALATAERYGVVLTSIDTNAVDDNFAKVLDGATGEFKDMYSQSASQLRQVLVDNKAMSRGVVIDSAVKSATTTQVKVLLFIDQSITNTVAPDARIDRSRVAMTMDLVDGRWLASDVELK